MPANELKYLWRWSTAKRDKWRELAEKLGEEEHTVLARQLVEEFMVCHLSRSEAEGVGLGSVYPGRLLRAMKAWKKNQAREISR